MNVNITSFYRFIPLNPEKVHALKHGLESLSHSQGLRGLCLLGAEGINATLSGEVQTLAAAKNAVSELLNLSDVHFKESLAERHPFNDFKVKIKNEIVTLGRPGLVPRSLNNHHLSPEQWQEAMRDPETIVIDTRNDYEVEIGKFKNAVDFKIKEFRDFPRAIESAGIDKNKKVLIYCTGGIRCEKAILDMNEQGFENVYQLEGGILNYLERFPEQDFEGECFVFDYRVAVDQRLQPTKNYTLCPHCGQPANLDLNCSQCSSATIICTHCHDRGVTTCSKNCSHHARIGSRSRRPHLQELGKRHFRGAAD